MCIAFVVHFCTVLPLAKRFGAARMCKIRMNSIMRRRKSVETHAFVIAFAVTCRAFASHQIMRDQTCTEQYGVHGVPWKQTPWKVMGRERVNDPLTIKVSKSYRADRV